MTLLVWLDAARFGLFIHWGHASQRGCEFSWPMDSGNPVLPQWGSLAIGVCDVAAYINS